jgi:hypothetical protein
MLSERIEKEIKDKQPQSISSLQDSNKSGLNQLDSTNKESTPKFKIATHFN